MGNPPSASTQARPSSVGGRLIRGFGASALGPVLSLVVQVGSVPIFLHYWGAALYGEWLILSAIPSYLALSDVGFGTVAASDMTMNVAAGRQDAALDTFQSAWVLVSTLSLVLMGLVCAGTWFVPWSAWLKLHAISNSSAALMMVTFSAFVLISLQNGIIDSAFRCDGNYALGTMGLNLVRFAEAVCATLAVVCGGRPLHVALTYLFARTLGTAWMLLILRRRSPWIHFGTSHANMASIRRLASPAFAFMAFPAGNAVSLQGLTLVVGIVLGPIAVVTFSTMRTLSRVGFQMLNVMGRTIWPELSTAFGAGEIGLARTLHRRACQAALLLSVACTLGLAIAGPYVYVGWTRHAVSFDRTTFDLLLLVILANSFWYTSSFVPMSTNQHEKIAVAYMTGTLISLVFAWAFMKQFGLPGAAAALLCIDAGMIWIVLRVALRLLSDTPGEFARSLVSVPNLAPLWRHVRGDLT